LTAEVVTSDAPSQADRRDRVVVDCGVRTGKLGETQMKPRSRGLGSGGRPRAGKGIDEGRRPASWNARVQRADPESELEKILLYVGDRAEVRRRTSWPSQQFAEAGIFDLTNALEGRDVAGALHALRALAGSREGAQRSSA